MGWREEDGGGPELRNYTPLNLLLKLSPLHSYVENKAGAGGRGRGLVFGEESSRRGAEATTKGV